MTYDHHRAEMDAWRRRMLGLQPARPVGKAMLAEFAKTASLSLLVIVAGFILSVSFASAVKTYDNHQRRLLNASMAEMCKRMGYRSMVITEPIVRWHSHDHAEMVVCDYRDAVMPEVRPGADHKPEGRWMDHT